MANALSVPGISVNNTPIFIVPNSYKSKGGFGEVTVRAASGGGGAVETVHTEDAESKIGEMSWEMYNTEENKRLIAEWKANLGANFISAQQSGIAPESMGTASMTNDPEREGSADGKIEVIFQGDPLSNN